MLFENAKSDDVDSYRVSEDGTTASVDIIPENYPSSNASKHMNEQVKVISIGNLGLLYIVTTDPTIQSIQNLAIPSARAARRSTRLSTCSSSIISLGR